VETLRKGKEIEKGGGNKRCCVGEMEVVVVPKKRSGKKGRGWKTRSKTDIEKKGEFHAVLPK